LVASSARELSDSPAPRVSNRRGGASSSERLAFSASSLARSADHRRGRGAAHGGKRRAASGQPAETAISRESTRRPPRGEYGPSLLSESSADEDASVRSFVQARTKGGMRARATVP